MEYRVGPGIFEKMAELEDEPASDEHYYRRRGGKPQFSLTCGKSGRLYLYLFETNATHTFTSINPSKDNVSVLTRFGIPPIDLQLAVKRYFPPEEWVNACEVAYLESGWEREARNNTVEQYGGCGVWYVLPNGMKAQSEDSRGYFQINACLYGHSVDWYDTDLNTRKAVQLWQGRGGRWGDWLLSATKLGLPI